MKIIQLIVCSLLAMFLCGFGCSSPKPTPDPLTGFHEVDIQHLDDNEVITADYKVYIKTLSLDEQKYIGPIFFYENGTEQHTVQIRIPLNGTWYEHDLFYDKDNKRIKVIDRTTGGYQS